VVSYQLFGKSYRSHLQVLLAHSCYIVPTFRDKLSASSSQSFWPWLALEEEYIVCPLTSLRNFLYSLRNNTEQRSSHLLPNVSLESFMYYRKFLKTNAQYCAENFNFFIQNRNYTVSVYVTRGYKKEIYWNCFGYGCKSLETDCNLLVWKIMEQAAFITSALCKIWNYRIKRKGMDRANITHWEMLNVHKSLFWIPEGQRPSRAWRRSEGNSEIDVTVYGIGISTLCNWISTVINSGWTRQKI